MLCAHNGDVGSGIGRQLSIAYARAGCQNITLADINPKGAMQTAKLIKAEFPDVGLLEVVVDVTDEASVYAMVAKAIEKFGSLECGKCSKSISTKSTRLTSRQRPMQQAWVHARP